MNIETLASTLRNKPPVFRHAVLLAAFLRMLADLEQVSEKSQMTLATLLATYIAEHALDSDAVIKTALDICNTAVDAAQTPEKSAAFAADLALYRAKMHKPTGE